jgi:exo-beta-1,3-glucanase (GH17 family)
MRKGLWIVIVLILLVVTSLLMYSYYPKPTENEVNVCLHLSDYGCSTISYLTELGVEYVRTDWLLTDDNSMRDYSQKLQDNNINLLAIVNMSKFGNQINLEEWNETVIDIVNSEGFNNTDAVEICNEPNNSAYFIPAETYFEMLKSAYIIIKNYANISVVFAGVSPNIDGWQDYLNTVFAHDDVEDYFDYMGIHFYYDDMEENLSVLQFVEGLKSKPIWLTETGKPSTENYNETWQAEYLSSIYSTFKSLVSKIFIYELKDNPAHSNDPEGHFGLLTVEGARKEAYWVVCEIIRK